MDQNIIIAAAAGFFIGAVLVWIIKNTNQSNAEHLQEESEALRKEYEALKKNLRRLPQQRQQPLRQNRRRGGPAHRQLQKRL